VLVSVKAAAVNFPDVLMIQNKYQHRQTLPFTPGYEIAGVVKTLGENVRGLDVGDAGVAMLRSGGFAEEVRVPAERFWRIPSDVDFVDAAAFPLAYGTSYHALKDRGRLQPGETLLVLGAAGGVGLAAVRRAGADVLIDYSKGDPRDAIRDVTEGRGVDVALDPVGGAYAEPVIRSMAWFGRYLVVGFTSGEIPRIAMNLPLLKGCSLVGVAWDTYSRRNPEGGRTNIAELIAWIRAGRLRPVVTARYTLEQAPRALEDVMERRVRGKVVIVP
jgi:NADPH2:quinone reductase